MYAITYSLVGKCNRRFTIFFSFHSYNYTLLDLSKHARFFSFFFSLKKSTFFFLFNNAQDKTKKVPSTFNAQFGFGRVTIHNFPKSFPFMKGAYGKCNRDLHYARTIPFYIFLLCSLLTFLCVFFFIFNKSFQLFVFSLVIVPLKIV